MIPGYSWIAVACVALFTRASDFDLWVHLVTCVVVSWQCLHGQSVSFHVACLTHQSGLSAYGAWRYHIHFKAIPVFWLRVWLDPRILVLEAWTLNGSVATSAAFLCIIFFESACILHSFTRVGGIWYLDIFTCDLSNFHWDSDPTYISS